MDVREHLKKFTIKELKDIARRHNALYRIKIHKQTKNELIESIARMYEKITGTHLIPKRGEPLILQKIKVNITRKKPIPKEIIKPIEQPIIKEVIKPIKKKVVITKKIIEKPIIKPIIKPIEEPIIKEIIQPIEKPIIKEVIKPIEEPKKLTYNELTPEQQKQAEKLIKKRRERKQFYKQVQKEVAMELPQIIDPEESEMNEKLDKIIETVKQIEEESKATQNLSYNESFVNALYTDNLPQEVLKIQAEQQEKSDLYITPKRISQFIAQYIMSDEHPENGVNILEPSAGFGALLASIIDFANLDYIPVKNLDAIEKEENVMQVLKNNYKLSNYYEVNFMEFKPDKEYNYIVMNPPYKGWASKIVGWTKKLYLYHIMKAILLPSRQKTVFAIIPQINDTREKEFIFNDKIAKTDLKKMQEEFNMPKLPIVEGQELETVNDFLKVVYSRRKYNLQNANLKMKLYKFTIQN